jgi:hypothetical protein
LVFGRVSRTAFDIFLTLGVLIVIGVGLLGWRLSSGPISLGFLTPLIEHALSADDESLTVDMDDTILAWGGWRRTFDIRMTGVRVIGTQGRLLLEVPDVAVSLSARAMLLHGLIAPTSLEITGLQLALSRNAQGELRFRSSADVPSPDVSDQHSPLEGLVAELLAPPDPERSLGYLRSVTVRGVGVTVADEVSGRTWIAREADITAYRDEGGLRLESTAVADIGGKPMALSATGSYFMRDRLLNVAVGLNNVDPAQLASVDPALSGLTGIDVALSGTVRLTFNQQLRMVNAAFDLAGERGRLSAQAFKLPADIQVRRVAMRGRLPQGFSIVELEDAQVDLGGPTIGLRGRITGLDARAQAEGQVTARNVPANDLRRLWPQGLGENARRWIVENLSEGQVHEANASFAAKAGESTGLPWSVDRLDGTLRFTGLTVNYLNPMPKIRGIDGQARFDASRFDITGGGGGVGGLRISAAQVALTALETDDEHAAIDVTINGPVREALDLVDGPPLGYLKKIDLLPSDFTGDAAIQLALKFPLKRTLKMDELSVLATAQVTRLTQKNAAFGQDITNGDVRIKVDRDGLDLAGRIVLATTPAEVEVRRNFADNAPFVGRTRARGTIGTIAREKFGFDLLPYVDGPTAVVVDYVERRGGTNEANIDATLDDATLTLAPFEWQKPPGQKGTARLRIPVIGGKVKEISEFQVVVDDPANGAQAAGWIGFAPDGRSIARIDLSTLKLGLTEGSGSYAKTDTDLVITAAGRAFDAGPFLRDRSTPDPNRPMLTLSVDVDRLHLADDRSLNSVRFRGQRSAERWETIELSAYTGEGMKLDNQVVLVLAKEQERQALEMSAADAGAFLKSLDISQNVIGGRLEARGATDDKRPGRPVVGQLRISEFRVVRAPVLARVLGVALLTGILDTLRGEGIGFNGLDVEFAFAEPVFEVLNARGSGSAIGITARGIVNIEAETIDIDGTIVPANALNSLPARIPLIGELLTGGGGGLFAALYRVNGPLDDPRVTVNPLSTLAPGFLRNLFGVFGGVSGPPTDWDLERARQERNQQQ